MVSKASNSYIGYIFRIPKKTLREIFIIYIKIYLNNNSFYVDKDKIIVILPTLLLFLIKFITYCDHVELIQHLEIWIQLFPVFYE